MEVTRPWRAKWITSPSDGTAPLPVFRRVFEIDRDVTASMIRICGLGQFELGCNGAKVGDDVMEGGWTDYRKTCLFVTHDLTEHLKHGQNIVEVLLGNGMYNVVGGRYRKFTGSFGAPMLIAQIDIRFEDGSTQQIITDRSWQVAAGPITFSCIYGGEDFDARLEPGARPTVPSPQPSPRVLGEGVRLADGPGGELVETIHPPIRVMQTFTPIGSTDPRPGVRVFDLGQNFSGRPKITVRAKAGETITLRTGELLGDDGCVNQKHTGSPVTFSYTARGDGEETWHPRFSYTGFRYVQAEGNIESLVSIEGQFIHSTARVVGEFECSSDLFNRIHKLILAAIKSNMHSVFTDCPHREKLGWLEQTHLMGPSILYNFDAVNLYRKILRDMRDAQHDNGCVPTIAPQYTSFKPPWDVFNDSPEWGSAIVVNPWLIHQFSGERDILQENYDAMKRFAAYLSSRADSDGLIRYGLSDWYDIGPGRPGFCKLTSMGVTATAIQYQNLWIMHAVAQLLSRAGDADVFARQAKLLREQFNAALFDAANRHYDTGSQAAQAMPVALRIVRDEDRAAVLDRLIGDIRARDNHITAGDIGARFVFESMAAAQRNDVVFDLLSRADPPSYGAQLAAGATALTEAWDANPRSSHNHFMLGHAEEWFYKHLAGLQIDLSRPPGEQIIIRPAVVGDITWARAHHEAPQGRIASQWERKGELLRLEVLIPSSLTARVHVPGEAASRNITAGKHVFESRLK